MQHLHGDGANVESLPVFEQAVERLAIRQFGPEHRRHEPLHIRNMGPDPDLSAHLGPQHGSRAEVIGVHMCLQDPLKAQPLGTEDTP